MSRRHSRDDGSLIPKINSIFQGMVVGVKDYGAFIKIPGCVKNGLVHISQLSKCRVDNVSEVVNLNDKVWCKVISLGEDSNKISLSMKVVHQGSGQDLDPNGVQIGLEENRRKTFTQFSQPKIQLEAVFNTVCKKCGTKGHLAQDCFQSSGGKSYDLIDDDGDGHHSDDDKPMKRHSKEHKSKKSKKKHKKNRSEDDEKSSSSSGEEEDQDEMEKEKRSSNKSRRRSHKDKKEKRSSSGGGHRSSSTSGPSTSSKRKRRE